LSERPQVLVADSAPTRLAVRMALGDSAEICAEAGERTAAVRAAIAKRPDVCLIGRSLPGGGIETVREIRDGAPGCQVVVLVDSDETDDLLDLVRAGAVGYLPVGFTPEQVRRAIEGVRAHRAAIPRSMVRDLVDEIRMADRSGPGALTAREAQILRLLGAGESTATMAKSLAISPVTVRRHISELAHKVGASGRAELVAWCADSVPGHDRWSSRATSRSQVTPRRTA